MDLDGWFTYEDKPHYFECTQKDIYHHPRRMKIWRDDGLGLGKEVLVFDQKVDTPKNKFYLALKELSNDFLNLEGEL